MLYHHAPSMRKIIIENQNSEPSLTSNYIHYKNMMHEDFWFEQELKQMEKRITEKVIKEVLTRLSVEADVSDAVLNIKELQDAINNLTKGGK